LLDWGVRTNSGSTCDTITSTREKVSSLLGFYRPAVVAFKCASTRREDESSTSMVGLTVKKECFLWSVRFQVVTAEAVGSFFAEHACETKFQIAQILGEWLPELAWSVPSKRMPWQSERHAMAIFEAAAVGITYFQEVAISEMR
jgi:hypothetical protein